MNSKCKKNVAGFLTVNLLFFLIFNKRYEKISLFRNILINSKRMHQVLGAGIIIFRETNPNVREYLLLEKENSKSESWAPPKGM